jgi:hypothetical protein
MNVVCNNPVLYVVDYPALDALEVIDKRCGRGVLMRAEAAQRFRADLMKLGDSENSDDFADLIGDYDALLNQPAIYH